MSQTPTVERAFELARSGECLSVGDIRKRLKAENCEAVEAQLAGRAIQRALAALCLAAKESGRTR
jgi:hypothetical protein